LQAPGGYRPTHNPSGPSFRHDWLCEADGDGVGDGLGDNVDGVGDGVGESEMIGGVELGLDTDGVGLALPGR
jgi:hypothetical protein